MDKQHKKDYLLLEIIIIASIYTTDSKHLRASAADPETNRQIHQKL